MKYVIGIDQSTQGTKALLFDERGDLLARTDIVHEQIVDHEGWVSHNPMVLYQNTVAAVQKLILDNNVPKNEIVTVGISNQRETSLIWNRRTGKPLADAVVWHCARAKKVCEQPLLLSAAEIIRTKTGLPLSPYFPAAKFQWLLAQVETNDNICLGTVDSWLVFKLTGNFRTDLSNAARTQLFNIHTLQWDEELCRLFGIPLEALPEVCDSDSMFGQTDFDGFLPLPIPIHAVMGDSNGALFGQGCHTGGKVKATYGTGSSIMLNTGGKPQFSTHGLATSIAWGLNGQVNYVLEGNINHTGSVISWMKNKLHLFERADQTEDMAKQAAKEDPTVFVPAFTGLAAPYWDSNAKAMFCGMTLLTGLNELVKAGLESIAFQINDVLTAMKADAQFSINELSVDGSAIHNSYLMQFQADLSLVRVSLAPSEELSGIGAAYAAGIAAGVYNQTNLFKAGKRTTYYSERDEVWRRKKLSLWYEAITRSKY